jgi:hypothetical protein
VANVERGKLAFRGAHRSLVDWERVTGIGRRVISGRLRRGWSVKDALTRAVRRSSKKRRDR